MDLAGFLVGKDLRTSVTGNEEFLQLGFLGDVMSGRFVPLSVLCVKLVHRHVDLENLATGHIGPLRRRHLIFGMGSDGGLTFN